MNGGSATYYGYTHVGYGGYATLVATGSLEIGKNVTLRSTSGTATGCAYGRGGQLYIESQTANVRIDGDINAQGVDGCSYGGGVVVYAPTGLEIGSSSKMNFRGKNGGAITLYAYAGDALLYGYFDVRGRLL